MTLTTHAVVGAAATSFTYALVPAYPAVGVTLGFAAAFASHFVLDSIPHWAEGRVLFKNVAREFNPLFSDRPFTKKTLYELGIVCIDGLLGLFGALFILCYLGGAPLYIVVFGAAGGEMPDALQFVYFKLKPKFMAPLQHFHSRIQTEYDNIAYLGIEAGIIFAIAVLGIFGLFVL